MRGSKQSALPVCRMGWTGNMSDCNAGWIRNRELAGDRGITLDKITERRCYRCIKLAGSKVVDVVGPMCWQFYLTLSICHFILSLVAEEAWSVGKKDFGSIGQRCCLLVVELKSQHPLSFYPSSAHGPCCHKVRCARLRRCKC